MAWLLAGADEPPPAEDELPVSVEPAPAALESVALVEGAGLVEPVVSVEPAGAEALVSVPELGSAGVAAAVDDDVVPVGVAEPEGSGVGVAVGPAAGVVEPGVPVGPAGALGSVELGAGPLPPPPVPVPVVGVRPPLAPCPGLTVVDVDVAPPDDVEVLAAGDDGLSAEVDVAVPVDGGGMTSGALAEPTDGGAGRAGAEASSRSRVVGGAAAR